MAQLKELMLLKGWKNIIRWLAGLTYLFLGLTNIGTSFIGALLLLLLSTVLIPISGNKIFERLSLLNNKKAKWSIVIALLIVSINFLSIGGNKKAAKDIEKVEELIKEGNFDEALSFVEKNSYKHEFADYFYGYSNDMKDARSHEKQIKRIVRMTDDDFQLLNDNNLKKEYYSSQALNYYYIKQLYSKREEGEYARRVKKGHDKVESDFTIFGEHKPTKELILSKMRVPKNYEFHNVLSIGGKYQYSNNVDNIALILTAKAVGMDIDLVEMKEEALAGMERRFGKIGDRYFFQMWFGMMTKKEIQENEEMAPIGVSSFTKSTAEVILDIDGNISFISLEGRTAISTHPWKDTRSSTLELKF